MIWFLTAMEKLTPAISTVAVKVDSVNRISQDANTTSLEGVEPATVAMEKKPQVFQK